ncbi:unnamed protein product [Moneuplotes crassus]|uniref:Uncharacterized protein n=1 Tax=Euplotes crassus TaxID=5936 RepID=A0AAD1U360_EUPCR|nr:unnamed protein product [Moneuplotes crassus]
MLDSTIMLNPLSIQVASQCYPGFCWDHAQQSMGKSTEDNNDEKSHPSLNKYLSDQTGIQDTGKAMKELLAKYCICIDGHQASNPQNKASEAQKAESSKASEILVHEEAKNCNSSKSSEANNPDEHKRTDKSTLQDASRLRSKTKSKAPKHDSDSEEFTLGRAQLNYNTRKDVVFKAAFRRLRKYFIKEFAKDSTSRQLKEDYPQRLRDYCKAKFPEARLDRVCVIFDCIVNAKGRLGTIPQEDTQLKDTISKLLYFYSEKKFRLMNEHPEFFHVLLYFISLENVVSLIFNEQKQAFQQKVKAHLNKLKVLATCMKTPQDQY